MQIISASASVPRAMGLNCREAVEVADGRCEIQPPEEYG